MRGFNGYEIRPVTEEDAEGYAELVATNRGHMAPYFPKTMEATIDLPHTRRFLRDRVLLAKQMKHLTYVITIGPSGRLIGGMSLREFDWTVGKAEMGFFLDQQAQGKGIATRAVAALLSFGFGELRLNKVIMRIGATHHRSRRVAERNGLRLEGLLRQDFKTYEGPVVDIAYYGILKSEYSLESEIRESEEK